MPTLPRMYAQIDGDRTIHTLGIPTFSKVFFPSSIPPMHAPAFSCMFEQKEEQRRKTRQMVITTPPQLDIYGVYTLALYTHYFTLCRLIILARPFPCSMHVPNKLIFPLPCILLPSSSSWKKKKRKKGRHFSPFFHIFLFSSFFFFF